MNKAGEAEIIPQLVWNDAEARLGLMEEQTQRALANRWKLTSIAVVKPVDWESPLLLPDGPAPTQLVTAPTLLLGPDGELLDRRNR